MGSLLSVGQEEGELRAIEFIKEATVRCLRVGRDKVSIFLTWGSKEDSPRDPQSIMGVIKYVEEIIWNRIMQRLGITKDDGQVEVMFFLGTMIDAPSYVLDAMNKAEVLKASELDKDIGFYLANRAITVPHVGIA